MYGLETTCPSSLPVPSVIPDEVAEFKGDWRNNFTIKPSELPVAKPEFLVLEPDILAVIVTLVLNF